MRLSPRLWNLLVWNGRPRGLAVPLLLEFATEGLFYVVHVERTDSRAGDAVDGAERQRYTGQTMDCLVFISTAFLGERKTMLESIEI